MITVQACNPLSPAGMQGCAAGQKCTWIDVSDAPEFGELRCVPDGTVALGGTCTRGVAGEATGFDNCAAGGICIDTGSGGVCRDICGFDGSASAACAVGEACTRYANLFANGDDDPVAGACSPTVRPLAELSPAKVWIGLKNSDAVGLRIDLLAEVFVGSDKVGEGQLANVTTGSSGFNNALLQTIPLALTGGAVDVPPGTPLSIRMSARRTCTGGGHNSGTVRLWYDGQPTDSGAGRDAGSRFDATIDGTTSDYFLRSGFTLDPTAGAARVSADAAVNSAVACPDRPYTTFGTWSLP